MKQWFSKLFAGKKANGYREWRTEITYLQNYPRQGEKIVLAGLKSPVTRNRNMAIRVLDKWKQENWSPEIRRELMHLKDIEPNQNTRVDIVKILNGQEI